jgi:F-type H+-transporting ATPase subunit c
MGDLSIAFAYLAAGIGAGIVTIGAGLGIGKIAASAMDGTARQPEATNAIRTTMIIAAALIEGVALIGAVACLLLSFK